MREHVNPLTNILGYWSLKTETGELYTEGLENFILFIPLTLLMFWALKKQLFQNKEITLFTVLKKATIISFGCSLGIEVTQLIFSIGWFQISDLVFNTLGGMFGGVIYAGGYRCVKKIKILVKYIKTCR